MFGVVRTIVGCVALAIALSIVRKSKPHYRRLKCFISIILVLVLTVITAYIPFENICVTFSSPETAYRYYYSGKYDIKLVISGQISDFVIGTKDDVISPMIIRKLDNGWKVGIVADTKVIAYKQYKNLKIEVYQYKRTDDYFLSVQAIDGIPLQITDNRDSNFVFTDRNIPIFDTTFTTYYTYISHLDSEYRIIVNDEEIAISDAHDIFAQK